MRLERAVLDTNVLISGLLIPTSVPGEAVRHALMHGLLLSSDATLTDLANVLGRQKFDAHLSLSERREFIHRIAAAAELVPTFQVVQACRDPRDDKFLEVAVSGAADVIVSGDRDLLDLHHFRDIAILTPAQYLAAAETNVAPEGR